MNKNRILSGLLAIIIIFSLSLAYAEQTEREIIVANPTKLNGMFFTNKWGNNTSDIDVRELLHGLSTIEYRGDGEFTINVSTVKGYNTKTDAKGNSQYIFTIYDDLYFSDGSQITAKDYVYSVLLQASEEFDSLGNTQNNYYNHLLGFEDYKSNKTETFAGVHLIDDYTFALTVKAEFLPNYFQLNLINVIPYPMAALTPDVKIVDEGEGAKFEEALDVKVLEENIFGENGYLNKPSIVTGPYVLTSYNKATGEASFEANEYYKGNYEGQKPSIKKLKIVEANNETMVKQLVDGEIDIINKITWNNAITEVQKQSKKGNIANAQYDRRGLTFLSFQCDDGPTESFEVRYAFAHILNRNLIINKVLKNNGKPVYGFYGIGQEMVYEKEDDLKKLLNVYTNNQYTAEKLLIEAGWEFNKDGKKMNSAAGKQRYAKDGETLVPLTLSFAITNNNPIGEEIAAQLSKSFKKIGGTIEVTRLDTNEFFEQYYRQKPREYDIMFLGTNFDKAFDPSITFSTLNTALGEQNTSGLQDVDLEELAQDMLKTQTGDKVAYYQKWEEFQKKFVDYLPMLPIYSNIYWDAFSTDIINYHPESYSSWAQAILYAKLK